MLNSVYVQGYVLLSMFMGGQLPWASATSFEETRRIKASTDIRALCIQHKCEEVAEVILAMRNADGGQRPPYPFIHSLLQSMADKNVTKQQMLSNFKPTKYNVSPFL